MRGIIVLDGPDACGKTTLAKAIQTVCEDRDIPYLYLHALYKFKDKMFTYHEALVRRAINHSQIGVCVIDRLYWSQYVYSKVYRNGNNKWPLQYRYFDRLLQRFNAMNIICCGETIDQVVNWHQEAKGQRSELYSQGLDEVASEYINIYNKHYDRSDYLFYCRDWHSLQNVPKYALKILQLIQDSRSVNYDSAMDPTIYNLIGNTTSPEYLFVGDILNNKGKRDIWPFWEYAHSSLYITKLLDKLGFDESAACWTNAFTDSPSRESHLSVLVEWHPDIKVVALGQRAERELKNRRLPIYKTIFHPSYAKRFNKKDYVLQLQEVLKPRCHNQVNDTIDL